MKIRNPCFAPISAALALALALPLASAVQRGTSEGGVAFVSGGATDEELNLLRSDRKSYTFWLATAALGSGAHLADVKVRITEAVSGRLVVEHKMDGPWLFAALPAGRYAVEATIASGRGGRAETQRMSTTIGHGQIHQSTLYFDTGDQTEADVAAGKPAPAPARP